MYRAAPPVALRQLSQQMKPSGPSARTRRIYPSAASFNGIVGLKPTYGLVSRYGLLAFASSLDQIGPLVKDVTDAAIVLNAIAGHDPRDSTSIPQEKKDYKKALVRDVKGMKIGVPKEFFGEGIKEETKAAIDAALDFYRKEGAEIVPVSIPHINSGVSVYYIIAPAEASSNLARYDGVSYGFRAPGEDIIDMYIKTRSQGFGEEVKRRIMLGNYVLSAGYYDAYYLKALKVRTLLKQEFDEAFKLCDVIAAPSLPAPRLNSEPSPIRCPSTWKISAPYR